MAVSHRDFERRLAEYKKSLQREISQARLNTRYRIKDEHASVTKDNIGATGSPTDGIDSTWFNTLFVNGFFFSSTLRSLDGTLGSAQPYCATPFMHYEKEERLARLDSRRELRQHLDEAAARNVDACSLEERVEKLEELLQQQGRVILELSHLAMDYRDRSGDKREEWLEEGSEEAIDYALKVGVPEHREAAREAAEAEAGVADDAPTS